jgi:hypothetical protein
MTDTDRTVHASGDGQEIVRYDRAGHWYIEFDRLALRPCRHIGVAEAARLAVELEADGGTIFTRMPGGRVFDRKVRDLKT